MEDEDVWQGWGSVVRSGDSSAAIPSKFFCEETMRSRSRGYHRVLLLLRRQGAVSGQSPTADIA